MKSGAVIVAAGMSSRMGDFKPMLNIGSISIAQRIIATLHQAGVSRIVVVTGYNAEVLERHLSKCGVIFLRNENYRTTQMFDSAKIGLDYMRTKCKTVLFTPVDIPMFTACTITKLMESGADLACPVCEGRQGHPILLSASVIGKILEDQGENGLQGALSRCGVPMKFIEVEDCGILHDADTPDDYRSLLEYHNSQLVRPEVQISLAKERPFFDEKIAMLLTLVGETSSVRTACQRMQLSYSSGWNIINSVETQLGYSLVERKQGGASGGKSLLTHDGRKLLRLFELFEKDVKDSVTELYDKYFSDIL
ncbi:MAG: LysR family transcriptional regulator [Clostridia bacterium]|nr:LysR family transcriptional regulator [Clostridia bacterium]NCC68279.1 LysR family transcriptional regulator [Clostridia bacterium]